MEQEEQVKWNSVNKLLQHNGFKPVCFADPVENRKLSDLVLLDKKSCRDVRTTLTTMLTDTDRRQALIQELIKSNNQLKDEAQEHMSQAALQSQRASKLEQLLDQVKSRVQELEERYLGTAVQQHTTIQQLHQDKQLAQNKCWSLEQRLTTQEEENTELQRKLYFAVKEEERRVAQQDQTFQDIFGRSCQRSEAADQHSLEVINFYETKMTLLQNELRDAKGELESFKGLKRKTICNGIQKQQRQNIPRGRELKEEIISLKEELEERPTREEMELYKVHLHHLEGVGKKGTQRTTGEHLLENDIIEDQVPTPRLCALYHNLLEEITTVVRNASAPLLWHQRKPSITSSDLAGFQALLPTLETWAQQLHLLKNLQSRLEELSARMMPWKPHDSRGQRVEDLVVLVDTMLENTVTDDDKVLRSPTRHTLSSFVAHFQKLFDVPSLSGIYPRMNEVYTRLAEMTNAMRNLREVLDLDRGAPPAQVVNRVTRLVSSDPQTHALHSLLRDDDIESIKVKVRQHEEFFPVFHTFITDIQQTLGVTRLDDIIPTLKLMKQATPS